MGGGRERVRDGEREKNHSFCSLCIELKTVFHKVNKFTLCVFVFRLFNFGKRGSFSFWIRLIFTQCLDSVRLSFLCIKCKWSLLKAPNWFVWRKKNWCYLPHHQSQSQSRWKVECHLGVCNLSIDVLPLNQMRKRRDQRIRISSVKQVIECNSFIYRNWSRQNTFTRRVFKRNLIILNRIRITYEID